MSLGLVGTVASGAIEVPIAACSVVGGVVLAALTVSALKTSGVALPLLICGGVAAFILGAAGTTIAAHGVILLALAAVAVAVVAALVGVVSAAVVGVVSVTAVSAAIQGIILGIQSLFGSSDSKPDEKGEPT